MRRWRRSLPCSANRSNGREPTLARNRDISAKAARDIDSRVERVLRNSATPSLRCASKTWASCWSLTVRLMSKYSDIQYRVFYTDDDAVVVPESISRIRIGVIQLFRRPTLLADVIRKCS